MENRRHGVPRIGVLRPIGAPVRFLSVGPPLGDLGPVDLGGIRWVIVGGESGRGARPVREERADRVHRSCKAQGVPFFFKQWGAWEADGARRSKGANGRPHKGKVWDMVPLG